jgi:hypothetical protein
MHPHILSIRQALPLSAAAFVFAACRMVDQPVSGPGEVTQVLVLPESVSIDPGEALQFQAVGLTTSGGTEPVGVRWLATGGGKIDDNGNYMADDHPGHFEVRATLDHPNLVASSQVKNRGGLKEVILNFSSVTVPPGSQIQFSASGAMANGDPLPVSVTYTASNGTVSASGLYTAGQTLGASRVIATALSSNKTLADTAAITISSGASPTLTRVVLEPPQAALAVGGTQQFAAYGRLSNGDSVAVGVTYAGTGGTVTPTGLYTAGQTTGSYRVIATQGGGTLADTSTITISGGSPTVTAVVLAPASATLAPGATKQFSAYARLSTGDSGAVSVTYIATGGTITGAGLYTAGPTAGTYRVIAVQTSGTLADTSSVTITTSPVASVQVSPSDATLTVGTGMQLQVTLKDASGATLSGRPVVWSSSNTAVATVSAGGSVIAIDAGTATVTATCEGKSGAASITVTAPTTGCTGAWPAAVYPPMPPSTGQAFYVSPASGSDANPGTITAPWKTLQKAFDALQPGQIAYLRAGTYGAFCSSSSFSRAGTAAAPITVRGYPGERAVLHGQIRLEGSYFRLAHVVVEGPSCGTWGAATQQGENLVLMVPGTTHHVEVSNSEVYHSGWHAGIAAGGDDIWILNNYIHDNGGFNDPGQYNTSHGIYYHDGTRGVVANNILEHNRAKGLSARYSGNHIIVANNTVVGNGRSGIDLAENTHDWIFANNIVVNNGNVNDGVGIHTSGSSGGTTHIEINNMFWNNGVSGTSNWDTDATITNNKVADPRLVSPVSSVPSTTHQAYSNDYHLGSGSPALGFATAAYLVPFALDGLCRPQGGGPDLGAYEQ